MGLLDRTRTLRSHPASHPSIIQASGLTCPQLLAAADAAYELAEQEFDRSPETRDHPKRPHTDINYRIRQLLKRRCPRQDIMIEACHRFALSARRDDTGRFQPGQ